MDYVAAIAPSIGVLALFVIAMRGIFHADQRERLAQAQIERAERAEAAGVRFLAPNPGPNSAPAPAGGRPADSSGNQAAGGVTE
jgi:hypothetical protein